MRILKRFPGSGGSEYGRDDTAAVLSAHPQFEFLGLFAFPQPPGCRQRWHLRLWCDPDIDQMFEQLGSEMDRKRGEAILHKMQQIEAERTILAPIFAWLSSSQDQGSERRLSGG